MEKIDIEKGLKATLLKDINELTVITDSDRNINYLLPKILRFTTKVRMIDEFKDSPNNWLGTFLMHQALVSLVVMLRDKSEKWHEMNKEEIKKIRKELSVYFNGIKKGIKEESLDQIINTSKMYLYKSEKIFDDTTSDFPE